VGEAAEYEGPAISPDGRYVAADIVSGSDRDFVGGMWVGHSAYDIWVFDLTRGTQTRLTFDGHSGHPFWSADGKKVFYFGTSSQINREALLSKPADNSAAPETVLAGLNTATWGTISADGRYVAYMASSDQPGGSFDIWGVDLQGDRKPFPVVSSPFRAFLPTASGWLMSPMKRELIRFTLPLFPEAERSGKFPAVVGVGCHLAGGAMGRNCSIALQGVALWQWTSRPPRIP
jgi:hypothetical protein